MLRGRRPTMLVDFDTAKPWMDILNSRGVRFATAMYRGGPSGVESDTTHYETTNHRMPRSRPKHTTFKFREERMARYAQQRDARRAKELYDSRQNSLPAQQMLKYKPKSQRHSQGNMRIKFIKRSNYKGRGKFTRF